MIINGIDKLNIVCYFRGLWRSFLTGEWVSGHDMIESDEGNPPNVSILKCETCGRKVITWQ